MSNCDSCSAKESCGKDNKSACQVIESNNYNSIKNVIGVMSGKGGVGKSTIAANLALSLNKQGYKVGIMDADITGPSIPRILGAEDQRALMFEEGLRAVELDNGLKAISLNFLIEEEKKPVIWRGPIITNTVKQFYQDVIWGELDYLIIDMPPGTGDVTLTVMQSLPLDGVVMVAIPQDMVSMIVSKAIDMTKQLGIHVYGVVENMSYMQCPCCDEKIKVFSSDTVDEFLKDQEVNLLAELPIKAEMAHIDTVEAEVEGIFKDMSEKILAQINKTVV